MRITAWRIVKARHVRNAFDGEGARRFGGRWNSRGTPMVYTAGSQALAVLELLVHLNDSDLLKHYRLIPVTFDARLAQTIDTRMLPRNWRSRPTTASVRAIGDLWIAGGESVVLRVPSALVPDGSNYLLNPMHRDFPKLVLENRRTIGLIRGSDSDEPPCRRRVRRCA